MLKELTHEETLERIIEIQKLVEYGDEDAAMLLAKESFPMPASVAKGMYAAGGKDFLLSLGYDLSEAEAAYGPDWMDR